MYGPKLPMTVDGSLRFRTVHCLQFTCPHYRYPVLYRRAIRMGRWQSRREPSQAWRGFCGCHCRPRRCEPHDMSKTDTTRVVVKPGNSLPQGKTDWARLDAMTDEEVVAAALSDPDAQPLTPEQLAKMRRVSRVKVLRQRLGMTQLQFADAFHLPITTLRDWEQHRSTPDAPARALLLAIERDPEIMRRLLAEAVA